MSSRSSCLCSVSRKRGAASRRRLLRHHPFKMSGSSLPHLGCFRESRPRLRSCLSTRPNAPTQRVKPPYVGSSMLEALHGSTTSACKRGSVEERGKLEEFYPRRPLFADSRASQPLTVKMGFRPSSVVASALSFPQTRFLLIYGTTARVSGQLARRPCLSLPPSLCHISSSSDPPQHITATPTPPSISAFVPSPVSYPSLSSEQTQLQSLSFSSTSFRLLLSLDLPIQPRPQSDSDQRTTDKDQLRTSNQPPALHPAPNSSPRSKEKSSKLRHPISLPSNYYIQIPFAAASQIQSRTSSPRLSLQTDTNEPRKG